MENTQEIEKLTFGEKRVRLDTEIPNESLVYKIKKKTAELIDLLEAIKNDEVSKTYDFSIAQLHATSGEKLRLIELAKESYESGELWASKAATHED